MTDFRISCVPFLTLALSCVACSSSDADPVDPMNTDREDEEREPEEREPEETPDPDPMAPDPTDECDPEGAIPCYEGIAEPCRGLESGFLGDEFCLAPPDDGLGYQLHVGPSDYTDPDETAGYMIAPGDETNWAEIKETPNDTTVFTTGYVSHMRPGSHHYILYALGEEADTGERGPQQNGSGAESAVGALGGTFVGGATRPIQNALLLSDHPDDAGVGTEWRPHQPVAVNLHFINTGEEPLLQEIWVNYRQIAEEDIRVWSKPITWYGGFTMNIPPDTEELLKNASACRAPDNVRILGATGHVHASTVRYNATFVRAGETEPEILFEDYNWGEPTEFRFNHEAVNPEPDPVARVPGGQTGPFLASPEDEFFWECEVENRSGGYLQFSNEVYTGEMCNVFGFYATEDKEAGNWLCAF